MVSGLAAGLYSKPSALSGDEHSRTGQPSELPEGIWDGSNPTNSKPVSREAAAKDTIR